MLINRIADQQNGQEIHPFIKQMTRDEAIYKLTEQYLQRAEASRKKRHRLYELRWFQI
jgi:hypothetical protein